MLDPFWLPASQKLADWTIPLADKIAFWALPLHIHEVLFFFGFYVFIQFVGAPVISRRLFPKTYGSLRPKTRINWNIHVVALIQSVYVCAISLWIMYVDEERKEMGKDGQYGYWERVFGYTGAVGLTQAAGCGYFLWDLLVSARYLSMFGPGVLAHAVSAFAVFSFGFRPFVTFYTPVFMLYELSSPFLNIHWFCDKLNLTGSRIQLVNGIVLLVTFFGCRLVYGSYQSFCVFYDIWRAYKYGPPAIAAVRGASLPTVNATSAFETDPAAELYKFVDARTKVPVWMALSYLVSNSILNALNWYWMSKMVGTLRSRFPPPLGTAKVDTQAKGRIEQPAGVDVKVPTDGGMATGVARGVYADGHRSVEVEGLQVRQRPDINREHSEQVLIP